MTITQPRKPGLPTAWYSGIKHEDQVTFEQVLRSSHIALGQLYRMVKQKEAVIHKRLAEYTPDQPYRDKVTHLLGQLKATQEQLELLAPFA